MCARGYALMAVLYMGYVSNNSGPKGISNLERIELETLLLYHTSLESSRCRKDDCRSLDPLQPFLRPQRTHEKCRAGTAVVSFANDVDSEP
jgi:hypothetical protein